MKTFVPGLYCTYISSTCWMRRKVSPVSGKIFNYLVHYLVHLYIFCYKGSCFDCLFIRGMKKRSKQISSQLDGGRVTGRERIVSIYLLLATGNLDFPRRWTFVELFWGTKSFYSSPTFSHFPANCQVCFTHVGELPVTSFVSNWLGP